MFLVALGDGNRLLGPDRAVLPAADQIEQIAGLEQGLGHLDLAQHGAGNALLVATVADAVGGRVTEMRDVPPQDADAEGVESGDFRLLGQFLPKSRADRSFISSAALLVKVTARMRSGTMRCRISSAMR